MEEDVEERLLKVPECQRLLGLSRSTVMALIARGELPSLTIGRSRRVALSSLTRWLEEREAASRTTSKQKAAPEVEPGTADEGGTHDAAPSG
jgi:excisionase family DNA binding protein